ncbi:MAG: NAD(P)-dependent oxidoreductase [Burkholderiaceae bacterium]
MGGHMSTSTAGFIGLGVMGAPMCRHLARKASQAGLERVYAYDQDPAARERLDDAPAHFVDSVVELCERSDIVLFCLPGGPQVSALTEGERGLVALSRMGQTFVDLGTTPVPLTRALQAGFAARGARFLDAPITRTRQAAEDGTLSILVGGDAEGLAVIEPLLRCFGTEVTLCGPIGAGQVVKQMNNMVLFQTVAALAEALATARAAGVDGQLLFDAMSKGSADSFALRNHGRKAMLPDDFPLRAFSVRYALKDLDYAIELAGSLGLPLPGAAQVRERFEQAIAAGDGDAYFPVIVRGLKPDA